MKQWTVWNDDRCGQLICWFDRQELWRFTFQVDVCFQHWFLTFEVAAFGVSIDFNLWEWEKD